ncbi:MAG: ATP-binding cassette domain-containing protein [Desulfotalea sp.]
MLIANNLSYAYGNTIPPVFQNFSLSIQKGERVGLFGDSGKGKTTLGRVLTGYLPTQTGYITINGEKINPSSYSPIQLIFQHPETTMNPRWKIKEILEEGNPKYHQHLREVEVKTDWLEKYPHELSGGELQRIALLRTMSPRTKYLIADEITSMLDAYTQALIWRTLLRWSTTNKIGMLIISHDTQLLSKISDRMIEI